MEGNKSMQRSASSGRNTGIWPHASVSLRLPLSGLQLLSLRSVQAQMAVNSTGGNGTDIGSFESGRGLSTQSHIFLSPKTPEGIL